MAVFLVVLAAFAHAGWNFAAKRVGDGGALFVWQYQTASAVIFVPVGVGVVFLGGAPPTWLWPLAIVVSAALHNTYAVILQRGYGIGDLSVVYPVARGSGPLLSVSAAVTLFGERPRSLALAGVAVVVLGVFVIGISAGAHRRPIAPGIRWGLLTGLGIACFTLWDAYSVTALAVPPLAYYCGRVTLQSLMLAPYALAHHAELRRQWSAHRSTVLTVAVLAPVASVSVLYALSLAPVSMIAPMRELSIVVAGLAAWRWLDEPNPLRRLLGAAMVILGITLIALTGST